MTKNRLFRIGQPPLENSNRNPSLTFGPPNGEVAPGIGADRAAHPVTCEGRHKAGLHPPGFESRPGRETETGSTLFEVFLTFFGVYIR